jgi:hypothetical protein
MEAMASETTEGGTVTQIVPANPKPLAKPTTPRAIVMAEALKEDSEQRALLQAYVREHMKEGTDYGVIPGTQKPTLLKPGAEKLTDLFRCTPTFDLLEKVEDWEAGLFHYTFRVRITSRDAGTVLAEGFGSANSREGRYRWRDARRKCPNCGKETIIKGKAEYGGGWVCFAKKGGCGAKWDDGAAEIEGQEIGKVENDDIFTLVNTILKMAKKRALVDGAIALARCSDIFTQDVEDFAEESAEPAHHHERSQARREPQRPARTAQQQPKPSAQKAPPHPYIAALWAKTVKEFGEAAKAEWNVAAVKALGENPKPSSEWTPEDATAVERVLFDVPF